LERHSTVAYSTCKFGPAVKALEAAIQRGLFHAIAPPPVAVLRKIILAGRSSAGMPPGAKKVIGHNLILQIGGQFPFTYTDLSAKLLTMMIAKLEMSEGGAGTWPRGLSAIPNLIKADQP